ncbi:MAG: methyl-accepting chemotaxis protein [Leptospira sp.]|nr:methyl-accepting chemotaxis protein [Leptospira sp.]
MQEKNKKSFRFKYIIDREFQIRFLIHFSILFIFGVISTLGFLYWLNQTKYEGGAVFRLRQDPIQVYHKVEADLDLGEPEKFVKRDIFLPDYDHKLDRYSIQSSAVVVLSIIYLALISIFSIFKSHKMAGPIHNIKRSLRKLADGEDVPFIRIRKGDEFQELVDELNEVIAKRINNKNF